jgi:hypothetical protein
MVVAYHKINQYGQDVAALGRIDPALALWGPFAVFAVLILWMYYRVAYVPGGQPIGWLEKFASGVRQAAALADAQRHGSSRPSNPIRFRRNSGPGDATRILPFANADRSISRGCSSPASWRAGHAGNGAEMLDLLGESGDILGHPGNGEAQLLHYVSLRVPQLIARFLPYSVLLATIITLATLNQNSEVIAMKAAGPVCAPGACAADHCRAGHRRGELRLQRTGGDARDRQSGGMESGGLWSGPARLVCPQQRICRAGAAYPHRRRRDRWRRRRSHAAGHLLPAQQP